MKKSSLMVALAALVTGATIGVAGLQSVSAASSNSNFVESLANKLGVSQEKVKSAFDQTKTEREQERQKKLEENLTQAVKDGKITEAQKSTIVAKLAEVKKQQDEMEKASEDLRNYIDDQNLDIENILPGKGMFHRGFGPR